MAHLCLMTRQAERSARLEAEARCAAALEALRRAGHPHSQPPGLPTPMQLPRSATDRATESITAARSLVASVCNILDGQPEPPFWPLMCPVAVSL